MRVAVATLFLALTASTTAFSDDVAAIGAGTATCGQYMNVYKRNPEETEKHFIGWMDGFFFWIEPCGTYDGRAQQKHW